MGREIKRVALDFDWPMNKVWTGFLNPHFRECPAAALNQCHGGSTNAAKWMDAMCRLITMLGEEAAVNVPEYQEHFRRVGRSYPHPYLEEWSQAPRTEIPSAEMQRIRAIKGPEKERALGRYLRDNPPRLLSLDAELADFVRGLSGQQDLSGIGSSVSWKIQKALLKAAGVEDEKWGYCKVCDGEGIDPAVKAVYDAWEKEEPPTGEGWQVWETVSEGSPVSPVFATPIGLEDWLVNTGGYSRPAAAAFIKTGWVMSGLFVGGRQYSDIEACAPGENNDLASKEKQATPLT